MLQSPINFYCIWNRIFIVYFIMLHMKQLKSNETGFSRFEKVLVIYSFAEVYVEINEWQLCSEIGNLFVQG